MISQSTPRRGDWMQTFTGRAFWPLDPRPDEVHLSDIAHSLALQCRYAGHCRSFFSVAQHSVLVSHFLPEELRLWGLLHDASEAYLVDLPRPVKRSIPDYGAAEELVMKAIATRFGLVWPMPAAVKDVDNRILIDESEALMGAPPMPWKLVGPPLGIVIESWSPQEAERRFVARFHQLASEG